MKRLRHIFTVLSLAVLSSVTLGSCIEDGITTSPSHQPVFSADTVQMGTLFTLNASPTKRFTVYNRHDKGLVISDISFSDDPMGYFRMNVDGVSGRRFDNVDIRPNDSIFIFVEATLPENGRDIPVDILAHIEFRTNGVSSSLPVKATGRDAIRLSGNTRFSGNSSLDASKPYLVSDSIVVEKGGTLTIPAGTELFMHDGARMVVHGTLIADGTAEKPVSVTGDRYGNVAASIPYEIMSGQWGGIEFTPSSVANRISYASIRNSSYGLVLDHVSATADAPSLLIVNSQVRNTKEYLLYAIFSDVQAYGCEFSDASAGLVRLAGGKHDFGNCTFANYYLFTALGGPALQLSHLNAADDAENPEEISDEDAALPYMSAVFSNSIIYGNGKEINHADLDDTDVYLKNCLFKSTGSDDEHFIGNLWDTDPMYYTVRNDYLFDYRLKPGSPAADAGDPAFISPLTATDRFGTPRDAAAPSLGAYQFKEGE